MSYCSFQTFLWDTFFYGQRFKCYFPFNNICIQFYLFLSKSFHTNQFPLKTGSKSIMDLPAFSETARHFTYDNSDSGSQW